MKILVTGGSGFIGMNMVRFFLENNNVTHVLATYCNKRPKFEHIKLDWVQADLRDPLAHKGLYIDIDIVIMCAAITSGSKNIINNPSIFVENNMLMNHATIKFSALNKVKKVVFLSCSIMYPPGESYCKEEDVILSRIDRRYVGGAYMKIYSEGLCRFFSINSQTQFLAIRHSNCYGPYDKFDPNLSHVFAATIRKVFYEKNEIVIWGEGQEKRDFLFVSDLVSLVDNYVVNDFDEKYLLINAGSDNPISIEELNKKVINILQKNHLKVSFDTSQPSIPVSIFIDSKKALKNFGWTAKTNIDIGIKKTVDWFVSKEITKEEKTIA